MKRIVLESPYAGNVERNIAYAKLCVKDMLKRGEAPIASHLLFTQPGILDDLKPEERKLGIEAGQAWLTVAEGINFYVDFGVSNGMKWTLGVVEKLQRPYQFRNLPEETVQELLRRYPD
jgi:hypothetical protein